MHVQESDLAAFTLVDAVAEVVHACNTLQNREGAILPAMDKIVDCMNDIFLGKAYAHRTASEFVSLLCRVRVDRLECMHRQTCPPPLPQTPSKCV